MKYPQIILLNGASSSGKSTLAKELRVQIKHPYFYYSSDQLVDSGMLPKVDRVNRDTDWSWNVLRPKFFEGFHMSISSFAKAGLNLIVEHVVEKQSWFDELVTTLVDFEVFYIGVFCPPEILDLREKQRGDREIGEGRSHIDDGIHTWSEYDITVDTNVNSIQENVSKIIGAIPNFDPTSSVFKKSLGE